MAPRIESRQRNSDSLLSAAFDEIHDTGIAGLSLRHVAQRAGLTQGAIYSNFADRTALLAACYEGLALRRMQRLQALLERETSLAEALDALKLWLAELRRDRRTSRVMLEFQLHALRDTDFQRLEEAHRQSLVTVIGYAIDRAVAAGRIGSRRSGSELAQGLLAVWGGFAMAGGSAEQNDAAFETIVQMLLNGQGKSGDADSTGNG